MSHSKDHYAILGVHPKAEDVVIKAAYRALAQRYHPDRNESGATDSTERMREINEAYRVLSNAELRKQYDRERASSPDDEPHYDDFGKDDPPPRDPSERDWKLAQKYFPDLAKYNSRLEKVSWRLASSYRAFLLESKEFDKRKEIASSMERGFLEQYFGKNKQIVDFAAEIIQLGLRDVARDLNDAIRVLGGNTSAQTIISNIKREHSTAFRTNDARDDSDVRIYVQQIQNDNATFDTYALLMKSLGGNIDCKGFLFMHFIVEYKGKQTRIDSFSALKPWFLSNIIPSI